MSLLKRGFSLPLVEALVPEKRDSFDGFRWRRCSCFYSFLSSFTPLFLIHWPSSLPRLNDFIKIICYCFELFLPAIGPSHLPFGAGVLGCSQCILREASGVIFHFLSCLCEMFHTSVNKVFWGMWRWPGRRAVNRHLFPWRTCEPCPLWKCQRNNKDRNKEVLENKGFGSSKLHRRLKNNKLAGGSSPKLS